MTAVARRAVLAGAAALLLAPAAYAHRTKSVLTTVDWNPARSAIEVIHRIHSDDAEQALMRTGGQSVVDLEALREQARLMIYVETNFSLREGGKPVPLEPVGVELSGEDALVYFEARRNAPAPELTVEDRLLRDVFDQQVNLVNVRMGERVRTLVFAGRDGAKRAKDLL